MKKLSLRLAVICVAAIGLIAFQQKWFSTTNTEMNNEFTENEEEEDGEGKHQTGAEKQMMSWLWAKGYPDPTNLDKKYWTAWEQYLEIEANTKALLGSGGHQRTEVYGNWNSLGNVANIGGRVVSIGIDPSNTARIFIGTASGGIYKTINSGTSWTYVPAIEQGTGNELPVLGVASIVVQPGSSGNVILAGTGEVYKADTSNVGYNVWKGRGTYGIGILRSTNAGATWTRVLVKNMSQMFGIQMIKFDPNNANIVYACATDGLYKSTDAGVTWSLTPIFARTYVCDVAINPSNSNQLAVAFGNMVNTQKGVYYSTDGGLNWNPSTGISAFKGYIRLDNSATGSNLFASVGHGSGNELHMSTNFGQTWFAKTGSSHTGGQYWFAHDVAVHPTNANFVLMGGVNYSSYTSSNGTTGGSAGAMGGSHSDVHDIKFDPNTPSIVYVANDGGMYRSTNTGTSFTAINNGLIAVQFYANFAVSPTDPNSMIGGLQDNGVVKWNGSSWSSILGGDGGPSMYHPKNGQKVLYSNDARAVFWSTNNGGTEAQRLINLGYGYPAPHDDRTAFMSPVAISYPTTVANPLVMYVGSDNLHISIDSGATNFLRASPAVPAQMDRPIDQYNKPAIAMAVSRADRNKLYVATSSIAQGDNDELHFNPPARVLKSLNASNSASYTFANISTTLPDRFTTDFAISQFSDDSVYITMGGFGGGHVYLTPNGGTTWLNRSAGLPDVPFNAIVIDPIRPNVIYAACDYGVYVSHNKGINWYSFNVGLPGPTLVVDLQITADNQIVAATHGKGVYRSVLFTPPMTLPVDFISFTGENINTQNLLKWTVEMEQDLSKYVVERSTDGINFQPVGNVNALNQSAQHQYLHYDNIQGIVAEGFYYRLKALNNDGAYFYSDVIYIKIRNKSSLVVLGNPFDNQVSIRYQVSTSGTLTLSIIDMQGRLIRHEDKLVNAGTGTHAISNLTHVPPGTYILEMRINRERFTTKIVKQ